MNFKIPPLGLFSHLYPYSKSFPKASAPLLSIMPLPIIFHPPDPRNQPLFQLYGEMPWERFLLVWKEINTKKNRGQ
jgi:hypothetical protein